MKLKTKNDIVLKRVKDYYLNGWPSKLKEENEYIKKYIIKIVYYGNRVIISVKFRRNMLNL